MGPTALVTGLSRPEGIAHAVVGRLLDDGFNVFASGWAPHDDEMGLGKSPQVLASLIDRIDPGDGRFRFMPADLELADSPGELVSAAVDEFGAINAVVAVHARSSAGGLSTVTAAELDQCWAVNTRASLLLAQQLGRHFDSDHGAGRVIFFTSGQHIEPMGGEIAYAVSKGAVQQMTSSVSDQLIDQGITVNCINPGPVDTAWAQGQLHSNVAAAFPGGEWGTPAHVADLVSFLLSEHGGWITGQTINSEGGFRRREL